MHELALTQGILDIVCRAAADRPVRSVTLDVGRLCCASPEAISFCFELAAQGTLAAGARLAFRQTAGADLVVATMEVEEPD